MWDLPGPGLQPVSPALAGGFLTTAPPRKPENHVLKINISLTEGVHENLRRDPKVNNLTLLSLPFISWEQSCSKPALMPEQKKEAGYWEMLALGRGLKFSFLSAIIILVHKEEAKHRIQNLVAFFFFLSRKMRIIEILRTGWERVGQWSSITDELRTDGTLLFLTLFI